MNSEGESVRAFAVGVTIYVDSCEYVRSQSSVDSHGVRGDAARCLVRPLFNPRVTRYKLLRLSPPVKQLDKHCKLLCSVQFCFFFFFTPWNLYGGIQAVTEPEKEPVR